MACDVTIQVRNSLPSNFFVFVANELVPWHNKHESMRIVVLSSSISNYRLLSNSIVFWAGKISWRHRRHVLQCQQNTISHNKQSLNYEMILKYRLCDSSALTYKYFQLKIPWNGPEIENVRNGIERVGRPRSWKWTPLQTVSTVGWFFHRFDTEIVENLLQKCFQES